MSPGLRRALLFAIAAVVAVVCVRLGFWQLDRLEQRRAFNAQVTSGLAQPPVPVSPLLGGEDLAYRRATAVGRYDAAHEVILYGRPLEGRPGNHVLTPLVLDDGRALLVDRGWIPTDAGGPPVTGEEEAVADRVEVTGVLLASSGDGRVESTEPITTVREVDVARLDAQTPAVLVPGVYLLLQEQSPAQPLPVPAPLPELTEGPHMGYALQWFGFAAIAVVGYVVLARRERRRGSDRSASIEARS
jgi:surfeit locus 1 family protein